MKKGEVDEPLEHVNFDLAQPENYVKIGTKITRDERQQLKQLLLEHKYVFAWSHKDMLGIGEYVIEHKLNISPDARPIK